jgi:hypothetical protein
MLWNGHFDEDDETVQFADEVGQRWPWVTNLIVAVAFAGPVGGLLTWLAWKALGGQP